MAARVGLTGGIGSGKSAAAHEFSRLGIEVVDADHIAREVTRKGGPALEQIAEHFGEECLNPDGSLNRAALGDIVFNDQDARQWLERLLHPLIRQESDSQAGSARGPYCILEIPLLVETGRQKDMDAVIVVDCPAKIRRQRLLANRDIDAAKTDSIMKNQVSDAERLKFADYIINNSGGIEELKVQVQEIHRLLQQRFGGGRRCR